MPPVGKVGGCQVLSFDTDLPSAPDLTPYIVKADNHYYAGGSFGDVFRCWYRNGFEKEVAVKALRFKPEIGGNHNNGSARMLHRELGIWKRLDHNNIVPFLGIAYGFGISGSMSLVSLWMHNGTLHTFLAENNSRLTVQRRLQFLLDIANGLDYLHSIPVVHGDLNSHNVLLDENYNARLVDFGYASLVGDSSEVQSYLQWSSARPGSLRWAAPELVHPEGGFPRTTKSDIYSFGCVGLQVLSGKQPWSEVKQDIMVVLHLSKGYKPHRPAFRPIDDSHWNLIEQCWSPIEERPTSVVIVSTVQRFLSALPKARRLGDSPARKSRQTGPLVARSPMSLPANQRAASSPWRNESAPTPVPKIVSSRLPSDLTQDLVKTDDHYCAGGGFGDVYRCWYRTNGSTKEVAIKALRFKSAIDGDPSAKMLHRELGIWRRLNHPNVVPFLGIAYGFGMSGSMSLVSLWMHNESLYIFLARNDDKLALSHRLQFLLDVANGLHFLHSVPVVHGDLNCNNILLDADYTARLADFGHSSLMGDIPFELLYLQRTIAEPGALRWIAPEQIDEEKSSTQTIKSDIYSFGCVGLQVLSGQQPWSELREDVAVVLCLSTGRKPGRPTSRAIDDAHWGLIQRCWSSSEERPTAEVIATAIQQFLDSLPQPQPLGNLLGP